MTDWRSDRVGSALRGENPTVMARMPGAFAAIGDVQFLPGYCVLLTDDPTVGRLSDLPRARRVEFLDSMSQLGEVLEEVCRDLDPAFRRINLEILGNQMDLLHAHVWPRYDWEPPDHVCWPVSRYPLDKWSEPTAQLSAEHDVIRQAVTQRLLQL